MANWWGDGEKPTKAQIAARGKAKRISGAKFKQTIGLAVAKELGGAKALRKAVKQIEAKVRQKVIEQSLRKALRVSRRAIRGAVPVSQKYAKHLVGLFVGTPKGGKVWQAKAGLGVGKATEKKRKAQRTGRNTYTTRKGETKNRGVGIAAANIHWAVLGTADRTDSKNRFLGAMPRMIPDAVINGWKGSQTEMMNVFKIAIQDGIDKAVAQEAKKSGN
jgi:hypothetical protein